LVTCLDELGRKVTESNYSARIDTKALNGKKRRLAQRINSIMDSVVQPYKKIAQYAERIASEEVVSAPEIPAGDRACCTYLITPVCN